MRIVKAAVVAAVMALAAGTMIGQMTATAAAQTLKVVMHSDVKILDPMWTTAYIVRDHGYMVYDTLFAVDGRLAVQPQMVDTWTVSGDKLTYTFTLRDGLKFHDGQPVTSEDCIASIKRWAARDAMGQKLMDFTKEMKAVDARTFTLTLKEPYGLVLESLGKPSSLVPFIMPKRVADTPPNQQITEFIGSGPFVFRRDLWRAGETIVYEKFKDYRPRPEPASGLAGGKVVYLDRVEWQAIPDAQTAVNALLNGEIDMIEQPVIELLPLMEKDRNIEIVDFNPLGSQYNLRFNTLHKPFDNPKIRQAALYALNQKDFLAAGIGNPKYQKDCKAVFICGTPNAGGWHGFMTSWVSADLLDPVMAAFVGAACDKAAIGWPCDAKLEDLRNAYARAGDAAQRKDLAEQIQVRLSEYPTIAQLGQFNIPTARRTTVSGNLEAPAPVFWNVKKK